MQFITDYFDPDRVEEDGTQKCSAVKTLSMQSGHVPGADSALRNGCPCKARYLVFTVESENRALGSGPALFTYERIGNLDDLASGSHSGTGERSGWVKHSSLASRSAGSMERLPAKPKLGLTEPLAATRCKHYSGPYATRKATSSRPHTIRHTIGARTAASKPGTARAVSPSTSSKRRKAEVDGREVASDRLMDDLLHEALVRRTSECLSFREYNVVLSALFV
ncbi:hypothetical protein BD413DRAFT_673560 [Trametes elegans]|nr:hypothetical protein BD413DRAFT_673560 [Trametes elegans]